MAVRVLNPVQKQIEQVTYDAVSRTNGRSYVTAVSVIREAIASGAAEMQGPGWKTFLEALRVEAIPRTMRQAMWERIGSAAHRSLIAAYAGRKYRRPVGQYRVGEDRYSGGALGRALSSPQQYRATPFGLYFINVQLLDAEARHWRRLNFGAGAGGAEGIENPGEFPVTGMGLILGLEPDRRPGFTMPRGFWLNGGKRVAPSMDRVGEDSFYVARGAGLNQSGGFGIRPDAGRITRGIASRNFLDPPVRMIASRLRPELENLWEQVRKDKVRSKIVRVKTNRTRLYGL